MMLEEGGWLVDVEKPMRMFEVAVVFQHRRLSLAGSDLSRQAGSLFLTVACRSPNRQRVVPSTPDHLLPLQEPHCSTMVAIVPTSRGRETELTHLSVSHLSHPQVHLVPSNQITSQLSWETKHLEEWSHDSSSGDSIHDSSYG